MSKYQIGDIICFSSGVADFAPQSRYSIGKITEIDNLGTEDGCWYNIIYPNGKTTAQVHRCMIGEGAIHCSLDEIGGLFNGTAKA